MSIAMHLHTLLPALLLLPFLACGPAAAQDAGYLGVTICGECHTREVDLWRNSFHDRAMKEPTAQSVLGDFKDTEFTAHGVTSRFFKRDGRFFVRTDGPDGTLKDYPIRYTFGWYPLQQYLIAFPGGRLQSLGLAWDSRPKDQGGQRWFHLYPNEKMDHKNPLHWTAPDQTWNYQCADCHSTDLKKGYDAEHNVYDTRFAEINVACEACHGPGARHVDWARAAASAKASGTTPTTPADPGFGLPVDLKDRDGGAFQIDPATGKPARTVPRTTHTQTETCARCHSRRGRIWDTLTPGEALHQGFRLALLEPALYFPDGQIKDEDYEHGSFIQSRMYRQGVVCSDCHEPHSLKLKAEGNAVCVRCHQAPRYDDPSHHHHTQGGTGAGCVACHMPKHHYMVVDPRFDHSLRVPRPDLSAELGTPNACTDCHQDKDAAWAAAAVAGWFPDPARRGPHFGAALHAADSGAANAPALLLALAGDTKEPAIARATALERLHDRPGRPSPDALLTVTRLLADPDPLVRAAAVRYLDLTDLRTRTEQAWPLLSDPARTVRLEAARVLAPVMTQGIGGKLLEELTAALEEYVVSATVNADRPESNLNLGLIALAAGEPEVAERAYRQALTLDQRFIPAHANLADLYRGQGREGEAATQLEAGLVVDPQSADLHHALGLSKVRAKRLDAALPELLRAVELAPANTRYAYVYAVALDGAGRTQEAVAVLATAVGRDAANTQLLIALVQFNTKLGQRDAASAWLDKLAAAAPGDPAVEQLRGSLK
ncbi:tetratricopeptide repeat protein [uncultured Thiodictyon sp.]|uniref:tetratricopeptide repeat protein n=1 Tax=uncultured Thiodictyon sp. TaxID=1846217 RepID=UPI0025F649DB|nr:tetratricopeptide repeat protein [uncultured Thiodictyon sp.]